MIEARWAAAPQEEWDAQREAIELAHANAESGGDWLRALELAEVEAAAQRRVAAAMGEG